MIMCTHKHHVFFLETTTELSHSDATTFSCKCISDSSFVYISQVIFSTFDKVFRFI